MRINLNREKPITNPKDFLNRLVKIIKNSSWLYQSIVGPDKLDAKLREMMYFYVSNINRCRYCIFTHREMSRYVGLSEEEIKALESQEIAIFSEAEQAALEYARGYASGSVGKISSHLIAHYNTEQIAMIQAWADLVMLTNTSGNTVDDWFDSVRHLSDSRDYATFVSEFIILIIWLLGSLPLIPVISAVTLRNMIYKIWKSHG